MAALVSCLCVTHNRVEILRRAVACFQAQTWPSLELVTVFDESNAETRDFLRSLNDDRIVMVEVPAAQRTMTLGARRNLAVDTAKGEYVAGWDDDDWHRSDRIETQMKVVEATGKPGCAFASWIVHDESEDVYYRSHTRIWEAGVFIRKSECLRYPDLSRREDTPMVHGLYKRGKLHLFECHGAYVYIHHGKNSSPSANWRRLLNRSTPLSETEATAYRTAQSATSAAQQSGGIAVANELNLTPNLSRLEHPRYIPRPLKVALLWIAGIGFLLYGAYRLLT